MLMHQRTVLLRTRRGAGNTAVGRAAPGRTTLRQEGVEALLAVEAGAQATTCPELCPALVAAPCRWKGRRVWAGLMPSALVSCFHSFTLL